jgi:hypothetical protein
VNWYCFFTASSSDFNCYCSERSWLRVAECYRETWLAEDFSYESYFSVWWYCSVMA